MCSIKYLSNHLYKDLEEIITHTHYKCLLHINGYDPIMIITKKNNGLCLVNFF